MKSIVYVGLDIATITGIALWHPMTHTAEVVQVKGDPMETFGFIVKVIMPLVGKYQPTIVLENQFVGVNSVTTRKLIERYGFIKYSLMCNYQGIRIEEVYPASVRSFFKAKGKKEVMDILATRFTGPYLTDNHTDALACCIYQSKTDEIPFQLSTLKFTSISPKELK